ncbi:MAG: hypothetical protein MUC67_13130 [Acidobacteria bacterium]|nr:hypothetical protein [Acidobacteriota bacterium]
MAELLRLTEPTRTTQGFNYVILWVGHVAATVYRTGELSCSDFRIDNTPASVAEINAAATQIVTALAGLAQQARLAELIGRLCPVETVERAANGAVVMTVSL